MSTFLPNIPQATDNLDFSQTQILGNNQALDSEFGIDHYPFSNMGSNQGFHNKVTTPGYVASPPTGLPPVTTANPIFYAFQFTTPLGLIQWSRPPSDGIPTPLTSIQSPAAGQTIGPLGTLNVLDFTGINVAIAEIFAYGFLSTIPATMQKTIFWNGSVFTAQLIGPIFGFQTTSSGNIFQISNITTGSLTSVYWTLRFVRIQ